MSSVLKQPIKDLCIFCYEEVGHFSRHLLRKHLEEEEVKKILTMPLKSLERRTALISLRKRGNFVWKQQKNEVKPTRRPRTFLDKNDGDIEMDNCENYVPCVSCLGFYKKTYLWRHRKSCKANVSTKSNKIQHLSESQTFLAISGSLGNYLMKSRVKEEIFNIMRPDDISFAAKTDPLICLFGESYLNKHKRKQINVVVSNKMRELARLKLVLKRSTTITSLIDALKPELYEHIVSASKIISGYDPEKRSFKAPSLALHLGTSLKFICDVAKKAVISKQELFSHMDPSETRKNLTDLRDLINSHWCNDISSLANKVLNENMCDKPKLLPLTEDVKTFNNYVMTLANQTFKKLKMREDIPKNYKILSECTLAIVLVFNRKRIGEVQYLDIDTYKKNYSTANQGEILSALSELEKATSATLKRVVVFGKGSKQIPILFTKKMQNFIELLLEIRRDTDIVPKTNKYVFANPGSNDRWMCGSSILRKLSSKCGAKNPNLLTSSRFRKQIATILQLMNFEKEEMEQIARFMGHTEKTHFEFYR